MTTGRINQVTICGRKREPAGPTIGGSLPLDALPAGRDALVRKRRGLRSHSCKASHTVYQRRGPCRPWRLAWTHSGVVESLCNSTGIQRHRNFATPAKRCNPTAPRAGTGIDDDGLFPVRRRSLEQLSKPGNASAGMENRTRHPGKTLSWTTSLHDSSFTLRC